MKLLAKVGLLMVALIVVAQSIAAAEWRGIVPLHSSRADIVRLFNVCDGNKKRCFFSLENQDVQVVFSGWQGAFGGCPTSVPKDTVLLVRVRINKKMPIKELKLNLKQFRAFDPAYRSGLGYRGYSDEKSGLLINTYKGDVFEFDYIASHEDQAFCPRFYEDPRAFVRVLAPRHYPPTMSLTCPSENLQAGSKLTFLVVIFEDYDSVRWTISSGTIVSGQDTREITVDTSGLGGRKITATVEMTMEDDPRSYGSSCTVQILGESLTVPVDAPNKRLERTRR